MILWHFTLVDSIHVAYLQQYISSSTRDHWLWYHFDQLVLNIDGVPIQNLQIWFWGHCWDSYCNWVFWFAGFIGVTDNLQVELSAYCCLYSIWSFDSCLFMLFWCWIFYLKILKFNRLCSWCVWLVAAHSYSYAKLYIWMF